MQKKIKHIFQTPFTGKTQNGDTMSQEWFDHRTDLYLKYTLPSLKNQTNKNFLIWLSFRPQDKENPNTKRIAEALKESGLLNIMTFCATMFTEDRAVWHNVDLKERLANCLPLVKPFIEEEYVYETNLDSDDMVHKDFSALVQSKEFKDHGALYMKTGFAFHTADRLAEWNNPTSNQNYTIMFPRDTYLDAEKRLAYLNGFDSHEKIPEMFNAEQLPDHYYCTVIHGGNISTIWTHNFRGQEIYSDDTKKELLNNFL